MNVRRHVLPLVFAALLAVPAANAVAQSSALSPELATVKQSLEKYQDPYATTSCTGSGRTIPTGLFSPTNPGVKCVGYPFRLVEDAPPFVAHPSH